MRKQKTDHSLGLGLWFIVLTLFHVDIVFICEKEREKEKQRCMIFIWEKERGLRSDSIFMSILSPEIPYTSNALQVYGNCIALKYYILFQELHISERSILMRFICYGILIVKFWWNNTTEQTLLRGLRFRETLFEVWIYIANSGNKILYVNMWRVKW